MGLLFSVSKCLRNVTTANSEVNLYLESKFNFFGFPIFAVKLESLQQTKKCVYYTTAKLSSKIRKNSSFPKKKSLVGSTPAVL